MRMYRISRSRCVFFHVVGLKYKNIGFELSCNKNRDGKMPKGKAKLR